jgi:Putative transposase of IS4/5 family (DUF4096)
MAAAGALAASHDSPAGWPLAGSPPGPQRQLVPGAYRSPWRDLPERYGPWETVDKRFARWQTDGTWARVEAALGTQADGAGELDGDAQIDSGVIRAHQHAAGACTRGARRSRQAASKRWDAAGWAATKLHTICDGRGRNLATRLTRARTPTPASWSGWLIRCGWRSPVGGAGRAPG